MKNLIIVIGITFVLACNKNGKNETSSVKNSAKKADTLAAGPITKVDSNDNNTGFKPKESGNQIVKNTDSEKKSVPDATVQKKKRWNNKKKGVIIGATSGAIAGVVVSKKKGKGAIIGGVIGAGVGLATGAIIDNKEKKQ